MTDGQLLLPPFSQEAEEAVIGSVLISANVYEECALILTDTEQLKAEEYFYLVRHRRIWETFRRIKDEGTGILDLTTISEDLRQRGVLEEIGGYAYLIHLINNTPNSMHAMAYATLVQRTAHRRLLLMAADKIRDLAMNEKEVFDVVIRTAQAEVMACELPDSHRSTELEDTVEDYKQLLLRLELDRQNGKSQLIPMPAAWKTFTKKIPNVRRNELLVITGPSGSGKSAMAEEVTEHMAINGENVYHVLTEMNKADILHRRMSRHSNVPYQVLLGGDPDISVTDDAIFQRIERASDHLESFAHRITYDPMPDIAFSKLQSIMRLAAKKGYTVFVIDHFQDVTFPGSNLTLYENMTRAVMWLAAFAEKRNIVVVLVSQLNDDGKTKGTRTIFHKATLLVSFTRPKLQNDYSYHYEGIDYTAYIGELSPLARVEVEKSRFGVTALFQQLYHGPGFKWLDMSQAGRVNTFPQSPSRPANPQPQTGDMPDMPKRTNWH